MAPVRKQTAEHHVCAPARRCGIHHVMLGCVGGTFRARQLWREQRRAARAFVRSTVKSESYRCDELCRVLGATAQHRPDCILVTVAVWLAALSSAIGSVSFDEFCTVMAMRGGGDMTDEEFVDMLFEVIPCALRVTGCALLMSTCVQPFHGDASRDLRLPRVADRHHVVCPSAFRRRPVGLVRDFGGV